MSMDQNRILSNTEIFSEKCDVFVYEHWEPIIFIGIFQIFHIENRI